MVNNKIIKYHAGPCGPGLENESRKTPCNETRRCGIYQMTFENFSSKEELIKHLQKCPMGCSLCKKDGITLGALIKV